MKLKTKIEGFLIAGIVLCVMIAAIVNGHNANTAPKQQQPQAPVYASVKSQTPRAGAEEEKQPEKLFYGQSYYEGSIMSVYFYPHGTDNINAAATHIKFNNNFDIWLCGDQRSKIEPGEAKSRLLWSDEPNAVCVTNWELR